MARVGPYEFTHEWSAPNGDLYEVWNDIPDEDGPDLSANDVQILDNGMIVEWHFELGRQRPPTLLRIVEISRAAPGPAEIPLPWSAETITVPQAQYRPPGTPRHHTTRDSA